MRNLLALSIIQSGHLDLCKFFTLVLFNVLHMRSDCGWLSGTKLIGLSFPLLCMLH